MKPRLALLGAAALLLSACGSTAQYPVPAAEATAMLAGLGSSPALSPMPAMIRDVQVAFEAMPDGKSVQWSFTHHGHDVGRIVAMVEADGDKGSKVRTDYFEGTAPATNKTTALRAQLSGNIKQLLVEAVDSALDRRPYNVALRDQIDVQITQAMVGSVFEEVSAQMNAESEEDAYRGAIGPAFDGEPPNTLSAAAPSTDLSRFSQ